MKDSYRSEQASTERKHNGGGYHNMNYGRRETDIGDQVVSWKVSRLAKVAVSLVTVAFVLGTFWWDYSTFKSSTTCRLQMLTDVVVMQQKPNLDCYK